MLLSFEESKIDSIVLHHIGNSINNEPLIHGHQLISYNDQTHNYLKAYFLSTFKPAAFFHLHDEENLTNNILFPIISAIFENPSELITQSKFIASHLYEQSNHPAIKGGDFFVTYIKNCTVDREIVDAIGLYKIETKDTYLTVEQIENDFSLCSFDGININRIDKGALIFNTSKEDGYILKVIDATNKGVHTNFWFDHFLQVKQIEDAYFQTGNVMQMTRDFIAQELPQNFKVEKADQIDMLNKSASYFNEQEQFDLSEYANIVMQQPDIIDQFNDFTTSYQRDKAISLEKNFEIDSSTVKKKKGVFKSVIKLDKNFHVYVHGDRNKIEQGTDKFGRKYYTLWYDQEN